MTGSLAQLYCETARDSEFGAAGVCVEQVHVMLSYLGVVIWL